MAEIKLHKIKKSFAQTEVLKEVSLDIKAGEFLTLVGASGSGKSTLLRIISGLEEQTSGSIKIKGKDISAKPPKKRNLAMVFQSYALYPHLSVYENMQIPLRMRMPRWQRLPFMRHFSHVAKTNLLKTHSRINEVAKQLQIEHLLQRKPSELSGGQRQRVALGRAMVRKPVAFLMDEPLSNLDAKLRVHMRGELTQLHRDLNTTFIYVTHDQIEAMTMSDRIALLVEGELIQVDTPHNMYTNPNHLKVAEFIGSPKINLIPAHIQANHEICFAGQKISGINFAPEISEQDITMAIRPEDLRMAEHSELLADIVHIENMGSEKIVFAQADWATGRLAIKLSSEQAEGLIQGAQIALKLKKKHLMFFNAQGERIPANKQSVGEALV